MKKTSEINDIYFQPKFRLPVFFCAAFMLLFFGQNVNVAKAQEIIVNNSANSRAVTNKTFSPDKMLFAPNATFSNPATITVFESNTAPATPASPYPSPIVVSGLTGVISTITVTLNSLNVPRSNNLTILLVAPNGDALTILSEVGGTTSVISNATVTLSDSGAALLPATGSYTSGTYLPTDREPFTTTGDVFPAPAPTSFSRAAPTGSATLTSVFGSDNPNGTWNLYTYDARGGGGNATIAGYSLNITTMAGPTAAPATVSGRVTNKAGRGVPRAVVTVSDFDGQSISTLTNMFGYYNLTGITAGNVYILSVNSKKYKFNYSSQVINVLGNMTDVNFTVDN